MSEMGINTEKGGGWLEKEWYAALHQMLPNVEADSDESKGYQLFREFKVSRDKFEYTLYYQSQHNYNGVTKKRVDFDIDADLVILGVEHVVPSDVIVTYWGDARRAVV